MYDHDKIANVEGLPKPAKGSTELKALETFASEVPIILHTVNEYETQAVLGEMDAPKLQLPTQIEGPINLLNVPNKIILGMFGGYKSALVQTKQGENCKGEIEDALDRLSNIRAVIAIGVAYSKTQYKFGDVLVSKTIRAVTTPKFKEDRIDPRSSEFNCVPVLDELMNTFTRNLGTWKDFTCTDTGRNSIVYTGDIVSVSWLIADRETRDKLLENFPDAIGGEMEGVELVKIQKAHNIGVIIIKGAADYGDQKKQGGKKWQFTAAKAATSYAKHKLEKTTGQLFADD